jgi:predicted nucleic acid-binding protein
VVRGDQDAEMQLGQRDDAYRLHAAIGQRGGQPRRRALDLAIAATANVHGVALLTHNAKDFKIIENLVEIRTL